MNIPKDPFEAEHSEIMAMLHRLYPGNRGTSVISRLIDHLSTHFIDEDRLMRAGKYPNRDRHNEDHYLIQDLFLAHVPRISSGNITQEELDLRIERLQLHIDTEDAQMIKYLNDYAPDVLGLKQSPE